MYHPLPIKKSITDATAWQASMLIDKLLEVMVAKGALLVSAAKGQEVVRLLTLATQGALAPCETDVSRTWAASSTWTAYRGTTTHTATLRVTTTIGREHEGYRLTLADHTSY